MAWGNFWIVVIGLVAKTLNIILSRWFSFIICNLRI